MSDRARDLADDYVLALQHYLAEPEEPALARAYELGRRALTDGLGVLAIANAHSRALTTLLSSRVASHSEYDHVLSALEAFLAESLSPFEMANRGFRDATLAGCRLNNVLEEQAKRIASALHNEAGQLLTCVHLALADAARKLPPDGANEIHAARGLLDQTEQRLRNLAHELRPPILDDLGLVAALQFLADSISKRWGLAVTVQVSISRALPATLEATCYRIIQEALNNIIKHAQATHAMVFVHQTAEQISFVICDDGIGCDADAIADRKHPRGFGLREIREQVTALGGNLRMSANPPHGTALTVELPLAR